jgi:hypothetical protein
VVLPHRLNVVIGALVLGVVLGAPAGVSPSGQQRPADEALTTFGDLLAMTRKAVRVHSIVVRPEWVEAETKWSRASASLPAAAHGLRACWPPLRRARQSLERAHALFTRAMRPSDQALEALHEHKKLLKHAEEPLRESEQCADAVKRSVETGSGAKAGAGP